MFTRLLFFLISFQLSLSNGSKPPPLRVAMSSTYNLQVRHTRNGPTPIPVQQIEIESRQIPLIINFRSQSSKLDISQTHLGNDGETRRTKSEDEPDVLMHEVKRPVIQEIREIILPYRKTIQEVRPVQEQLETIVTKNSPNSDTSSGSSSFSESKDDEIHNYRRIVKMDDINLNNINQEYVPTELKKGSNQEMAEILNEKSAILNRFYQSNPDSIQSIQHLASHKFRNQPEQNPSQKYPFGEIESGESKNIGIESEVLLSDGDQRQPISQKTRQYINQQKINNNKRGIVQRRSNLNLLNQIQKFAKDFMWSQVKVNDSVQQQSKPQKTRLITAGEDSGSNNSAEIVRQKSKTQSTKSKNRRRNLLNVQNDENGQMMAVPSTNFPKTIVNSGGVYKRKRYKSKAPINSGKQSKRPKRVRKRKLPYDSKKKEIHYFLPSDSGFSKMFNQNQVYGQSQFGYF